MTQLTIGTFTITETGLTVNGNPTYEEWQAFGETLRFLERTIQFTIGDWLNYGEKRWGEKYAQAVEETAYSAGTLRNFASVAATFDLSSRDDKLKFAHYSSVMALRNPDGSPNRPAQKELLTRAVSEGLSARTLYKIAHGEDRERLYLIKNEAPTVGVVNDIPVLIVRLPDAPELNYRVSVWIEEE